MAVASARVACPTSCHGVDSSSAMVAGPLIRSAWALRWSALASCPAVSSAPVAHSNLFSGNFSLGCCRPSGSWCCPCSSHYLFYKLLAMSYLPCSRVLIFLCPTRLLPPAVVSRRYSLRLSTWTKSWSSHTSSLWWLLVRWRSCGMAWCPVSYQLTKQWACVWWLFKDWLCTAWQISFVLFRRL